MPRNWELRLARSLLAKRLGDLGREYKAVIAGQRYVPQQVITDMQDYHRWLGEQSANRMALIKVCTEVLIFQLPNALLSNQSRRAVPAEILEATESVVRLYKDTILFEERVRAVDPPEDWQGLHQLQFGWTHGVQDAIEQQIQLLTKIIERPKESEEALQLTTEIKSPDNFDEFMNEYDRFKEEMIQEVSDQYEDYLD